MTHEVELLSKKDIGQFQALVNHAFPGEKPFEKTWMHTSLDKYDRGNKHLGVREKGTVVSHVGIYPLKVRLPGALLKVAGVGAVATYEKCRGRGFMKSQLDFAEKLMQADKYDISWLAGERVRYGYFGWENGGRLFKYCLTERTTRGISTSGFTYKKYSGSDSDLKKIIKLHKKDGLGAERSYLDNKLCFGRWRRETLIAFRGKQAAAYVCLKKNTWVEDTGTVQEFGGGLPALKALFRYVVVLEKLKELDIFAPPFFNRYSKMLSEISSHELLRNDGMIKIIDLKSTLKKFAGQMSLKLKGLKIKRTLISFEIPELKQRATLEFGKCVRVTDKAATLKISLNRREMVRLLFGLSRLSDQYNLGKKYALLDLVLPLDLYFWRLETV